MFDQRDKRTELATRVIPFRLVIFAFLIRGCYTALVFCSWKIELRPTSRFDFCSMPQDTPETFDTNMHPSTGFRVGSAWLWTRAGAFVFGISQKVWKQRYGSWVRLVQVSRFSTSRMVVVHRLVWQRAGQVVGQQNENQSPPPPPRYY